MPQISFNGEPRKIEPGLTAEELLRQAGLKPESLIVLVNGDVVEAKALSGAVLKDGDSVDLLKLAGGG